jgi:hypothetical protein
MTPPVFGTSSALTVSIRRKKRLNAIPKADNRNRKNNVPRRLNIRSEIFTAFKLAGICQNRER